MISKQNDFVFEFLLTIKFIYNYVVHVLYRGGDKIEFNFVRRK